LEEFHGELLLFPRLVAVEEEDGEEVYYWTTRALRLCDVFWKQFYEHTIGGADGDSD